MCPSVSRSPDAAYRRIESGFGFMADVQVWMAALVFSAVGTVGCADDARLGCHEILSIADCNRQLGCRYIEDTGVTVFGDLTSCFTECAPRASCEEGLVCALVEMDDGTGFVFDDVCIDPP